MGYIYIPGKPAVMKESALLTGKFHGFDVEIHDPGIAVITGNQPERLNGHTLDLKRDLVEVLVHAQMDNAVRVVVFTGSGRAFCAGDDITGVPRSYGDVQEIVSATPRPGGRQPINTYEFLRNFSQPLNLMIRHLDKLCTAAINGMPFRPVSPWHWRAISASHPPRPGWAAAPCASAISRMKAATTF